MADVRENPWHRGLQGAQRELVFGGLNDAIWFMTFLGLGWWPVRPWAERAAR